MEIRGWRKGEGRQAKGREVGLSGVKVCFVYLRLCYVAQAGLILSHNLELLIFLPLPLSTRGRDTCPHTQFVQCRGRAQETFYHQLSGILSPLFGLLGEPG